MSKQLQQRRGASALRLYALGGLCVIFLIMSAMAGSGVGQWEREIMEAVYGTSDDWRTLALTVTQLGSSWFWLSLVALLFIIHRRPAAALQMFRNGALAYVAVMIIKFAVARPRPELLLENVVSREVITIGLGFPSAHVTIATVMAFTFLPYLKGGWRLAVPAPWIAGVAWSRLYLGVHAPLDILGGFVLGAIITLAVNSLPQKGIWRTK